MGTGAVALAGVVEVEMSETVFRRPLGILGLFVIESAS
jgi:hypothetical protein